MSLVRYLCESLHTHWCISQIAEFMGPTWGPPGSCRPQMGPMLASLTLLSGMIISISIYTTRQFYGIALSYGHHYANFPTYLVWPHLATTTGLSREDAWYNPMASTYITWTSADGSRSGACAPTCKGRRPWLEVWGIAYESLERFPVATKRLWMVQTKKWHPVS